MTQKVLFVDRDGTLIEEPADFQVDTLEKVRLVDGVIPAMLDLKAHGYRFVMVSNQDGLGTQDFPEPDFQRCQEHVLGIFSSQGVDFDEILICPHLASDHCDCRKPSPGLLAPYLAANAIDLQRSAVIGDRPSDEELAARIGVRSFTIAKDTAGKNWQSVVRTLCYSKRSATVDRKTRETDIHVEINLDVDTPVSIATGIGFYDHMLEQVARHGGFSLCLSCQGDLEIDEHHTVEDTAICLGMALREALGTKLGIARYGFVLPMDESEARISLDLSGRGQFQFQGSFPRESVGELSTEMVRHFFLSISDALGAALHLEVSGENTHHMVEACFKALGRALRQAVRREGNAMPSTKGTLA